jgi:transmembrane sensor
MNAIPPQILDEAARWQARLAAPDCTELDRAAYHRWLREDSLHARADAAAVRVSEEVAELAANDPRMAILAEEALGTGSGTKPKWRRWLLPVGIAASLLFEGLALRAWLASPSPEPEPIRLSTAAHERSDVTLGDGSKVHLDISSNLGVRLTQRRRSVELREGRALFEVAHDAKRPFTVDAGTGRVTAVGTRFQVQREETRVTVILVEGVVVVEQHSAESDRKERLQPGDQLVYSVDGSYWAKHAVDSIAATSWSSGHLVFRGVAIVDALAQINRYASHKIVIGDPALDGLEISGTFTLGDSAGIAAALTQILPIQSKENSSGEIILLPNSSVHRRTGHNGR